MKIISVLLQLIIALLAIACIITFVNAPSLESAAFAFFGIGLSYILWSVAIHLYKRTPVREYGYQAGINLGVLFVGFGALGFFALLTTESELSPIHLLGAITGGYLLIKNGRRNQKSNNT